MDEEEPMDTYDSHQTAWYWYFMAHCGTWHRIEDYLLFPLRSETLEQYYLGNQNQFRPNLSTSIDFSAMKMIYVLTGEEQRIQRSHFRRKSCSCLTPGQDFWEKVEQYRRTPSPVPCTSSPAMHSQHHFDPSIEATAAVKSSGSTLRSSLEVVNRGSKRTLTSVTTPAKVAKQWNSFNFTVYLMHTNCDTTPSAAQELQHMQAGLGKTSLCMHVDMTHSEVSSLFQKAFSKMKTITGGWLLYKSDGGNKKQRLLVVVPESEGYTGSAIRRASQEGTSMLYIVPLQEEFDLTPLPDNAPEFSNMPKAECKRCLNFMPLQHLALHVQQCSYLQSQKTSDSESEISAVGSSEENPTEGKCPICQRKFQLAILEIHANYCVDNEILESTLAAACLSFPQSEPISSASSPGISPVEDMSCKQDVLRWLAAQVDHSKNFKISVSRINLLERGLELWQRQKNSSPVNSLRVEFIGERGIDLGSLRKEFLTDMIAGIETRLFEGEDGKGKMPKYSLNDLDRGLFRAAGEIFAVSLAQGGPAPRFLQEWCYNFLLTGKIENIGKNDVHDPEFSSLIKMVEETSDLSSCIDEILNCGYTGPINDQNRNKITRAIQLHSAARRTEMLRQLREGLKLYGLINTMEKKSEICRGFFVAADVDEVDSQYIVSHLLPIMSLRGTRMHTRETDILNNFQNFLQELETGTNEDGITVPGVMKWITGQSHRHLLIADRVSFRIIVNFDHDCVERKPEHKICYPIVSACSQRITFPTAHFVNYDEFKNNMITAIKFGGGFYNS